MSTLYTFNMYIAARRLKGTPITEARPAFYQFCSRDRNLPVKMWDARWREFNCADARDERETMADALR